MMMMMTLQCVRTSGSECPLTQYHIAEWNPQLLCCRDLENHLQNKFNLVHHYKASPLLIFQMN